MTITFAVLFIIATLIVVPPVIASHITDGERELWFSRLNGDTVPRILAFWIALAAGYGLNWAFTVVYVLGFSS